MTDHSEQLTQLIRELARQERFDRVGICDARPIERADYVRQWLSMGRAGEMHYLQRYVDRRIDPGRLVPGARSVVVCALNYYQHPPAQPVDDRPRGRVARYAWGKDYHRVMKDKLWRIIDRLKARVDIPFEAKPCVDSSPILERELAMRAGVGWIGKNTMVLGQELGSYFFLGEIITTLDLIHDSPATDHCGSCTRCLDACPTRAFPAPYQMDARRCISYHTIELRGPIPSAFHAPAGDWIFGCDVCQEVCPYNRDAPRTQAPEFSVRDPAPYPVLADILEWSADDYRRELKGSAMKRAKLEMFQRNAEIALKNHREQAPA